ncbi:MAG: RagB/SusD family nutrient uptake outer membrane protein [Breznakibacter sp.]
MKKLIYMTLAASSLMVGGVSCNDFLEEDNKVGETADLTYSTKAGIDGLVASCYNLTRAWYGKEAGLGLSEMGTDVFYYGFDNKQKSLNSYNLTAESLENNTADNACLDHYWEAFYIAVDICNNALKYVPQNTVINESLKQQYMAEAYFLRAFYYFHMVNIWGPIPYNSDLLTSITTNPTREPEEVVYSNILADIDKSIEGFEASGYKKKTDGRANYWAAKALKARVLLYAASWLGTQSITSNTDYAGQNLYSLALAEAEDVIANSGASFYSNYADVWSMNNEDFTKNDEVIWGVAYSSDIVTSVNCIPKRYKKSVTGEPLDFNSLITRTGYTRGGSAMLLMFVSMWSNGATDFGPTGTSNEIFIRVLGESTSYVTNTKTKEKVYVADHYSPYGRGFTRYLPSIYLWKLLDKYKATDQRTDETLLEAYTIPSGLAGSATKYPLMTDTAIYYCPLDGNSPEGIAKQAWAKDRYRIQFLSGGDVPVFTSGDPTVGLPTEAAKATSSVYSDNRYNNNAIGGWKSYPGIKKFLDNVYNLSYPTHDISSRDAFVFRLAEMYLIKAEAQLATGGDALGTINALRAARAISEKDNSIAGPVDMDVILDERAIELCGEQQRWFDLKRTRKLGERLTKYNKQALDAFDPEVHYLRPIPSAQISAVTNYSTVEGQGFWQNPGY